MTTDREIKPVPTRESSALIARLHEVWRWLSTPPVPPTEVSSDWYAGLVVDPNSFSNQLFQLQKALRSHEGEHAASKGQAPVDSMAMEFGSESAA